MSHHLVLLPGTLCDRRVWEPTLHQLGTQSATVGHLSDADNVEALANDVLRAAPPRFALAGFSLGGIVALEIMARAPERVSHLMLVATTARDLPPAEQATRQARWDATRDEPVDRVVERDLWPGYVAAGRRTDANLREEVLAMARDGGRDLWRRQLRAALTRRDARPGLGSISVPTLVMTGEEDGLCPPAHAWEIGRGIAGALTEIVRGTGHFLPLEAPARLAVGIEALLANGSQSGQRVT